MIISPWTASLTKTLFWSIFMQIFWSIWDKNFNFVRPAVQFFPLKSHIWCKKSYVFESGQNFRIFASPTKGMDTFLFEMSMKRMFAFKNFRNVYWHGTTHSELSDNWNQEMLAHLKISWSLLRPTIPSVDYTTYYTGALIKFWKTRDVIDCLWGVEG